VSLLLEALKKAELAKQQGTGGPPAGESAPAAPAAGDAAGGLSLEPLGAVSAGQPLMTRDKLPDITQPLEIFSEDLAPPGGRAGAAAAAPAPGSAAAPTRPAGPAERSAPQATEDMERNSARQLFESKMGDYEPRRPFYFLLGALGIATLGVVGYFVYQIIAPRPSFYTGPAAGKSAPPPAAITGAPAAPATAASPAAAPSPAAPATQPAEPPAPTTQAPAQASAVAVPPQPTQGSSAPRPAPGSRTPGAVRAAASAGAGAADPAASRPRAPITVTASGPRVDPGVEHGWEALQAGDLARATDEYTRALSANPRDRDALLGLATIDVRKQDFASAEARYLKVLELDPRDAYAQAALLGLRGGGEAGPSESRLKTLIAQQPEASVLSFALGNQYASQRRWPEAQQAYFSAVSADPENADYAYNLAVSLDHLRQPKLALEYYQRALALAGSRSVGFNTTQVQARVRELQR
jgi:Tfp pilus assembly protein PilF